MRESAHRYGQVQHLADLRGNTSGSDFIQSGSEHIRLSPCFDFNTIRDFGERSPSRQSQRDAGVHTSIYVVNDLDTPSELVPDAQIMNVAPAQEGSVGLNAFRIHAKTASHRGISASVVLQ